MSYLIENESFDMMTCGVCGVRHLMPTTKRETCAKEGPSRSWFCPNGHERVYRESEADKVRRELNNARQQIARAEDEAREATARATKAENAKKRLEKRINAGLCPCCNRSFQNLARHMASKHGNVVPLTKTA